jgi:uncharacterized membrane protein
VGGQSERSRGVPCTWCLPPLARTVSDMVVGEYPSVVISNHATKSPARLGTRKNQNTANDNHSISIFFRVLVQSVFLAMYLHSNSMHSWR